MSHGLSINLKEHIPLWRRWRVSTIPVRVRRAPFFRPPFFPKLAPLKHSNTKKEAHSRPNPPPLDNIQHEATATTSTAEKRPLESADIDSKQLESKFQQIPSKKSKTTKYNDYRDHLIPLLPLIRWPLMDGSYFCSSILPLEILPSSKTLPLLQFFSHPSIPPLPILEKVGECHRRRAQFFTISSVQRDESDPFPMIVHKGRSTFVKGSVTDGEMLFLVGNDGFFFCTVPRTDSHHLIINRCPFLSWIVRDKKKSDQISTNSPSLKRLVSVFVSWKLLIPKTSRWELFFYRFSLPTKKLRIWTSSPL